MAAMSCNDWRSYDWYFHPFPYGRAAPLVIDMWSKSALALKGSTKCNSNGTEASLTLQIFFFFFGLVIIGVGVMTSSLEGSSFQVGNGDAGDGGLPYRSAPVTLPILSTWRQLLGGQFYLHTGWLGSIFKCSAGSHTVLCSAKSGGYWTAAVMVLTYNGPSAQAGLVSPHLHACVGIHCHDLHIMELGWCLQEADK